jgi:hypothetical protein
MLCNAADTYIQLDVISVDRQSDDEIDDVSNAKRSVSDL